MNEAEIRAQIVDVWLRDHGFTSDQIILEKTFNIQLGRGVYSLGTNTGAAVTDRHGRSDYLVRAGDGRNLFIVETKAAGEPIDDASRKQAISYARLLEDGGIAPFVILTNGRQTEIIDSISGVLVGGDSIPLTHPHGAAGFRISVDDFTCRAEALEHLISVSPENLLVFCRAQVRERMTRLRNDDLKSGFKYIPSLYVERERERERLLELISERQQCVLVLGPPQVGKTNFTCHFVEEQLSSVRHVCSIPQLASN
jgi:type I site-specific restriction endonuclease